MRQQHTHIGIDDTLVASAGVVGILISLSWDPFFALGGHCWYPLYISGRENKKNSSKAAFWRRFFFSLPMGPTRMSCVVAVVVIVIVIVIAIAIIIAIVMIVIDIVTVEIIRVSFLYRRVLLVYWYRYRWYPFFASAGVVDVLISLLLMSFSYRRILLISFLHRRVLLMSFYVGGRVPRRQSEDKTTAIILVAVPGRHQTKTAHHTSRKGTWQGVAARAPATFLWLEASKPPTKANHERARGAINTPRTDGRMRVNVRPTLNAAPHHFAPALGHGCWWYTVLQGHAPPHHGRR